VLFFLSYVLDLNFKLQGQLANLTGAAAAIFGTLLFAAVTLLGVGLWHLRAWKPPLGRAGRIGLYLSLVSLVGFGVTAAEVVVSAVQKSQPSDNIFWFSFLGLLLSVIGPILLGAGLRQVSWLGLGRLFPFVVAAGAVLAFDPIVPWHDTGMLAMGLSWATLGASMLLRKPAASIAGLVAAIFLVAVVGIGIPGFGRSTQDMCDAPFEQPPLASTNVIFHNGLILTMDEAQPQAQAIAIKGDRIVAVGSNEDILVLADSATQVVDLEGKTVLPGFIDSHEHRIGLHPDESGQPGGVIQDAIVQGWTSIDELFANDELIRELCTLNQNGELRLRVNAYLALHSPQGDTYGNWYQAYEAGREYSPYLRLAGVKIYMDHGWGHGELIWTQEQLNQMVQEAHDLNWQIAVHTVGEPAHTSILDALEKALGGQADPRYRHRIEHVIVISDEEIQRMKRLGIIASTQLNGPGTWVDFDDYHEPLMTPDLYPHFARWRDLFAAGVMIAGSSDWPGSSTEEGFGAPMLLLYQAVTRTGNNRRPPEQWMIGQAITIEEALRSLTINGAYATFEEDKKGSLTAGKLADLVILSANPLTAPIEIVPDIQVLMTMIGGTVEYCVQGQITPCP
jgi:hypothetical protein